MAKVDLDGAAAPDPDGTGDPSQFARALRHHRELRCLTQEELADKAGVSTRTIQNYESGSSPRLSVVEAVVGALGLDLMDREGLVLAATRARARASLPSEQVSPKGFDTSGAADGSPALDVGQRVSSQVDSLAPRVSAEESSQAATASPGASPLFLLVRGTHWVRKRWWQCLVAAGLLVGAVVLSVSTMRPSSRAQVTIAAPSSQAVVPFRTTVRGTARMPPETTLWVLVQPEAGDPAFFVGTREPVRVDASGIWVVTVGVGRDGRDMGERFNLFAVVSPTGGCVDREMAHRSSSTSYARMSAIPEDCRVGDQVEVMRSE